MSYNKVILQGNLTKDNELKFLPSGTAVVTNTVAVTEKYKTKDGQMKEENFFGDFVIFRGAETFSQYTHKGSKVLIEGKLSTDTWEKDGKMNYKTKIKVDSFVFLDNKPQQPQQGYQAQQQPKVSDIKIGYQDEEVPF